MGAGLTRTIAVTLRKGGSGKTTTAINLAAALHQQGARVLLLDLDPQANATLAVGIDPLGLSKHVDHLFTTLDTEPADVVTPAPFGLPVLPAHPDLAGTEAGMKATQVGMLRGLLEPLEASYDAIVIDTPPSESYLTVNALAAADEVIIPLQAHYLAMQGLTQALTQVEQVKRGLNPTLRVAGILPVMVNARTKISRLVLEEVARTYPDLLYPIGIDFSVKHIEASLAGEPIVVLDPSHPGAVAYRELAARFR
jgi:chromosome partitioning protein